MLVKKSKEIACYFVEKKIISVEDVEIYSYGMMVLFYYILNISSFLMLALVFGYLLESMIFLIAFSILRMFIGGYHSSTHLRCYIVSMLLYAIFLFITHNVNSFNELTLTSLLILSGIIIFLFAPGDTASKRLTERERTRYRKNGIMIYTSEVITISVLITINKFESVANSVVLAIVASSLLLIILKVMERGDQNGKENIKQSC